MTEDILNEEMMPDPSGGGDARAFAIAHGIVEALKRAFFSWLPFLVAWRWLGHDWPVALGIALVAGYALEACAKRWLVVGERDGI